MIKILLTSRNVIVATSIAPHAFVHQLNLLDETISLELLRKKIGSVQGNGRDNAETESLQRKMVKFCGGLPLALMFLGGWFSATPLTKWEAVFCNIKHHLVSEDESLVRILGLSYYDLPPQLKPCFLYLGSFPEDAEIKAETLYQLWIAEGFVSMLHPTHGYESVMELAEWYLGELSRRGMVQLEVSDEPAMTITSKYKSCRLHNLMRISCLFIAEEELFLNINGSEQKRKKTLSFSATAFRRRVINLSPDHNLQGQDTSKLWMLRINRGSSSATVTESLLENYVFLRVLSLEGLCLSGGGPGLLEAIGKLLLLRYLSFKDSSLDTLPASLTKLKHLQTLDLRVYRLCRLPDILWKIQGLAFLYLPSFYTLGHQLFKLRLDGLIKLEILENFNDRVSDPRDLLNLTSLRVLSADCSSLENLKKISDYSCSNKKLKHVSISTDCDFSSDMDRGLTFLQKIFFGSSNIHCFRSRGAISRFPVYQITSTCLVQLSMNIFGLKDDGVMGALQRLTNMRSLCLTGYENTEMIFQTNGFPQLRILRLFSFLKMKKWVVEEKAMPNLSLLSLWGFPALEMIPPGLASITTLKELDIRNMPEKFKTHSFCIAFLSTFEAFCGVENDV